MFDLKRNELFPPQARANEQAEQGSITPGF
jgi:hypothetical protein